MQTQDQPRTAQKETSEPEVPSALIDNEAPRMEFDVAVDVHKAARKKLVDTGAATHAHSQDALRMLGLHDPFQRTRRPEKFGGTRNVPAVTPHLRNLLFNIGAVFRPKLAFSLAAFRMQLLFTPLWHDNQDGLVFERPLLVGLGDGGVVAFLLWSTNSASWAGRGRVLGSGVEDFS